MRINPVNNQSFGKVFKTSLHEYKPEEYPSEWKNTNRKYGMVSIAVDNASDESRMHNKGVLNYLKKNLARLTGEKSSLCFIEDGYFVTGKEAKRLEKVYETSESKIAAIKAGKDYSSCETFEDEMDEDNRVEREVAEAEEERRKQIEEIINGGRSKNCEDNLYLNVDAKGEIKEAEYYKEYKGNNRRLIFKRDV